MPEWVCPRQADGQWCLQGSQCHHQLCHLSPPIPLRVGEDPGSATPQLPGRSSLASFCLLPTEETETEQRPALSKAIWMDLLPHSQGVE